MRQAFGECVFDRGRRELTYRGTAVHGAPKLLALLEVLLDAAPKAVTKADLHKALWPDTFVSDATLTSLVAELRTAIGDDARAPSLVRTIHGYGYMFVGAISEGGAPGESHDPRLYRIILGDREIPLKRGTHILGRSPDAAVCVDDLGVSRHHARITIDAHGAMLEDLESKNGTILNGEPLQAATRLADGSMIVLGATALRFRIFEALATTDTISRHERP